MKSCSTAPRFVNLFCVHYISCLRLHTYRAEGDREILGKQTDLGRSPSSLSSYLLSLRNYFSHFQNTNLNANSFSLGHGRSAQPIPSEQWLITILANSVSSNISKIFYLLHMLMRCMYIIQLENLRGGAEAGCWPPVCRTQTVGT